MKFTSIVFVHWSMNDDRSRTMRRSMNSLLESVKNMPTEIIVIDNGDNMDDTNYLLDLACTKKINTYIRNANNMHFGFARNQGLKICNGDYIAIVDNDIIYNTDWLETCVGVLEDNPDKKIYATPVYNVAHWRPKYWQGEVQSKGRTFKLNMRAGSNCWVMRRKDFEEVGGFIIHRIAGTKWTNNAVRKGYLAAVTPDIMVNDYGFRRGYNLNDCKPVKLDLHNGEEIYFNADEYTDKDGKELNRKQQQSFYGQ